MRFGGERRGNSRDRQARKLWMLRTFGNGWQCPCSHCSRLLTYATVESDRIVPGGPYTRSNVQPSCRACNVARSDDARWQYAEVTA